MVQGTGPIAFLLTSLALLPVAAAAGVEAGGSSSPGQPAEAPSMLSEVTVIGYRTKQATSATGVVTDIIDTPISISAITRDFLTDTGSSELMEAIGALSGVTGQNNSGEVGTNFGVRGYSVTPQVDGFDALSIASGLGASVGIDRIEVLKGPSAVFNGNVPPGGNINIIYKKPSFQPETYVQGEAGMWSYRSGELFSTGPVTDKFAYLVNAYAKDSDGWVDWTGQKERALILGATVKPIESLSFNFNYRDLNSQNRVSTLPVSHPGFIGSGANQFSYLDSWVAENYGPNEPPQTITVPQYLPGGRRDNPLGPQNYNDERNHFYSTELSWKANQHIELRDKFAYTEATWNFLAMPQSGAKVLGPDGNPGLLSGFEKADQKFSGWENIIESALYFDTGIVSHSLLIGYRDSSTRTNYARAWIGGPSVNAQGQLWNFFTDGPILLQDQYNARMAANPAPDIEVFNSGPTRTHAYYLAEQMAMLDDRVHALLGVRYTKTVFSGLGAHATTPQVGIVGKPFSAGSFFADTAFFANYSESFTPSGLVQPGTTQAVPPRRGSGREFGVKTAWLNGGITSTLSVFRDDLSNIATPDYSQQGVGGSVFAQYNLGGMGRAQGFEAEITWTPLSNLQLSTNYTYLPTAKYLRYPGVPQEVNTRFGSTPLNQANLTGKYSLQEGVLRRLYFGGWIHSQSATSGVLGGDWHYDVRIPSLTQVTAFVGYDIGKLDARLNIDNLTGRNGYLMNNAFQPQPPRAFYLTLKYRCL
jgi:outer membrane receptor protein involved in Fe transport